ncbi:hypothetical protein VIM7927_03420 [Vibrio mangrovi]|nr:hypothetical protein VIM7927_03420 [Vibrio mangrovi]
MLFGGLVGCSSTISVGVETSAMQHDVVHPDTKDVMQQIDQSYGYEFDPGTDSTSVGVAANLSTGHDAGVPPEQPAAEAKSTDVKASAVAVTGAKEAEAETAEVAEPVTTPVTSPSVSPELPEAAVADAKASANKQAVANVIKTPQTSVAEQKMPEQKVPEQKVPELNVSEQKAPEQKESDQKDWAYLPGIDEKFPVQFDHDATISQLHTTDMSYFRRNGKEWVQFSILSGAKKSASVSLPVMRWMKVPSANVQHAVVITWVEFGREIKERTEFMLTDTPQRSSPVLLGQTFFRDMGPIDVEQLIGR